MVVKDWIEFTPQVINNGFCDIWAEHFIKHIGGDFKSTHISDGGDTSGHSFVKYKDLYFDAEAPQGVKSPLELPYFQRAQQYWHETWDEQKVLKTIVD